MIILVNPGSGQAAETFMSFRSRGYRSFLLNTSRGDVCTVFDVKDANHPDIKYYTDTNSASIFKPQVPYILASRTIKDTNSVVKVSNVEIGGGALCVIGGPCSIESEKQLMDTAECVRNAGAQILRGGAFKPRSSPYAFQGMGVEGLKLLRRAGDEFGMPVITEVLDADDITVVSEYADILQIGARNCQNFSLLRKVGRTDMPVLLKRGMMTTIEEFLLSAEYVLSEGNMNVILCERGIRTFEQETRNTLDISAVPVLKQKTHLPVIVDPSHAAGSWKLVEPLALASVAAGADGLMIEVHCNPEEALCDGRQSLRPDKFEILMKKVISLRSVMSGV